MSQKRLTPEDERHLLLRTSQAGLPHGFVIHHHRHSWHQLVYATAGVLTVETPVGHWVVPPSCAVWLPANAQHSIRFSGKSALRTLYLRPEIVARQECAALRVSPLLRELIVRAIELHALDNRIDAHRAITRLLLDELAQLPTPSLELVQPQSPELLALVPILHDHALTTPQLARRIGMGPRTLERRFVAETGTTLYEWRRHARMLRALEALLTGRSMESTAEAAGYRTASAFIAAFHATFGMSPRKYIARLAS
jgi:AraC-like DNA-binding protein